jgi:putative membrane protein
MDTRQLCCAAAILLISGAALADTPRQFIRKAIEGDNSEIMLGKLAADQATTPGVKDFGRMLQDDHSKAKGEAVAVARRLGVRPSSATAPEARQERQKLSAMRGVDFDREFVRYMVEDHQKDVSDFKKEADEHHSPTSELASRQLPTLQKHLETAQSLNKDVRQ